MRMYYIMDRISKCKSVNHLFKDVETIEFYTDNSSEICQLIISNEWLIAILIRATETLNRSEPHKKVLSNVLGIIGNLAKKTSTHLLYGNDPLLQMVIKVFRNFGKTTKDKGTLALSERALALLAHMLQDDKSKKVSHFLLNLTDC